MDAVDWLAALIRLNGGEIVGKTRLQKIVYLLEAKDLGFGFSFDYHNYGPYSAEVSFALDDAEALELVKTNERPGFHEVPYTVYAASEAAPAFAADNATAARKVALQIMDRYSALVLELAATAVYLRESGYRSNYWDETRRRKPLKASPDRILSAKVLLSELGLSA
jgi:hypothetical protein